MKSGPFNTPSTAPSATPYEPKLASVAAVIADDEVAHALEAVAHIAERRTHTATGANPTRQRLRFARCCYGHLAGQLGVELLRGPPLPRLVRVPRPHGGQAAQGAASALPATRLDAPP